MNDLLYAGFSQAFGLTDCASPAMGDAIGRWFRLYYGQGQGDSCLQLPYTIVRKLVRAVFSEYTPKSDKGVIEAICHRQALEMALIGGESYLKPVFTDRWQWRTVPRNAIAIFARDHRGEPTDVGMAETLRQDRHYFTLLERRVVDEKGLLTIYNRLFRSNSANTLGREVPLRACAAYAHLPSRYTFPLPLGSVGLVRVKNPAFNCVDGSAEGVSVYAAAEGLINAIGENEEQLRGEFQRGQSRLVVSRDMLSRGQLADSLFVALDEDPAAVGIHIFSPQLREQSYLNRQQAYLRAVENIIGLKRGLLSQVEAVDRTATEITSSEGEYMTTVMELQRMWEGVADSAMALTAAISGEETGSCAITWGDGIVP